MQYNFLYWEDRGEEECKCDRAEVKMKTKSSYSYIRKEENYF